MSSAMYERMRANPKFHDLVHRRKRFAWTLAGIVLTMFYGFVLTVAFSPATIGQPISDDSRWTVGIVAELFLFVFFWLLTALYIYRANTQFDLATEQIINEARKESK